VVGHEREGERRDVVQIAAARRDELPMRMRSLPNVAARSGLAFGSPAISLSEPFEDGLALLRAA
jgi:hypothetical protein